MSNRSLFQQYLQPVQLLVGEFAAGPGGTFGDQRVLAAVFP